MQSPSEYCIHFNSTLAICFKFVFIEMLDKLITYIVWWYKTVYQVLSVAWTNRIILVHTTDLTWYKVLYHHTMYVIGIYLRQLSYNRSSGSHNRLDLIQSLVPPHYVGIYLRQLSYNRSNNIKHSLQLY